MHELPFAKSILKSVLQVAEQNEARRIMKVTIEVGVLRDFIPEIVQKYWNYVTKGSIAESSQICMNEIPASARCKDCGTVYPFNMAHITDTRCPTCGCNQGTIETGRELRIMNIEII